MRTAAMPTCWKPSRKAVQHEHHQNEVGTPPAGAVAPMPGGIITTCTKRLPGAFDTHREAIDATEKAARQHLEAIGYSAKRVEVLA